MRRKPAGNWKNCQNSLREATIGDMDPLHRQAVVQGAWGTVVFIALIFWPAGTLDYWQGWVFLSVFASLTIVSTVHLAIHDRPLLERRMKAGPQYEREWSQKIIVSLVLVIFFLSIVLPALDHRYGWSPVAAWVSILGNVLVVLSFLFMFRVIRVNSFAASNVRVEEDQKVIDTGPYAHVRHPMYAGAIGLFVGMPLALGSWWSLGLVVVCVPVLVWRLLDEERILRRDLPGYEEYMRRVRFRLVPLVW
jgi:protein-S-isoprenylcysteine O-methyltransferase Ste14